MAKKNYEEMSKQILDCVGGKENIRSFVHCLTRLRFNVRDKSLVKTDKVKEVKGVMGTQWSGEQFQVIIGQDVSYVYNAICDYAGLEKEDAINENLDANNKKLTLKSIGDKTLAYISGSMAGVLPVLIGAAMCKTIGIILGPTILNVISETSDMYLMFDFLYDVCFYFLPIFIGYTAAKTLNTNIVLGIFMGAMIIVPDFVAMIGVRESFSIFGISVPVASYAQTFLPVVLGVWIMSYIYKFLKKYIPDVLSPILLPTLTILIMTPIMFAICAPIGTYIGDAISSVFAGINGASLPVRILGSVVFSVLLPFVVLCGMHTAVYMSAYVSFISLGCESFLMPLSFATSSLIYGIALGAMFKMKQKENKGLATGYFLSGFLGGLSEPTLYGLVLKYKSVLKFMCIGNAIAGLLSAIMAPGVYIFGGTYNIFSAATYVAAGGLSNLINGLALSGICFAIGTVGTILFCDFGTD